LRNFVIPGTGRNYTDVDIRITRVMAFPCGGLCNPKLEIGHNAALNIKFVELEKRRGLKPSGLQRGFDAHGLSRVYNAML
jgi:hypothetical protein